MLFLPILGNFWFLVATVVTCSSNLNNFERKFQKFPKNQRKSKEIRKIFLKNNKTKFRIKEM